MSEHSQELVIAEPVSATLTPLEDPGQFVTGYVRMADELARIIRQKQLFKQIGAKEHVLVEGWTLLGSMLGVFPVTVWTHPVEENGSKVGWEARVEARTRDGAIVGSAEAECLRSESLWKNRDDYALRSMAQTRATSKALRQPLGFVMELAGFNATPAEEMPRDAEPLQPPRTPGEWVWPMGRHSGKTLADTPPDYCDWYLDKGQNDDIKQRILEYRADLELPFE